MPLRGRESTVVSIHCSQENQILATTLHEIESQARKWSESERARLASALIESLDNQDDGDVAETWRIEIERRWSEIESGAAITVSASGVFAEVRHSLK